MSSIPHDDVLCQEDIYIDGAGIVRRHSASQPIATPLADFLAASYNEGQTDTAGADAAEMTFEDWLANEPAWDYWEEYEEVIA